MQVICHFNDQSFSIYDDNKVALISLLDLDNQEQNSQKLDTNEALKSNLLQRECSRFLRAAEKHILPTSERTDEIRHQNIVAKLMNTI